MDPKKRKQKACFVLGTRWPFTGVSRTLRARNPCKSLKKISRGLRPQGPPRVWKKVSRRSRAEWPILRDAGSDAMSAKHGKGDAMRCKNLAMRVLAAEILCDAMPRCENTSNAMPRCRPLRSREDFSRLFSRLSGGPGTGGPGRFFSDFVGVSCPEGPTDPRKWPTGSQAL